MADRDPLASLAAELKAMRPRARRAVMAQLSPDESARIERAMAELAAIRSTTADADPVLSPWLAAKLDPADRGALTPATRQLLERRGYAVGPVEPAGGAGRSLAAVVGGLLLALLQNPRMSP